MSTINPYFTMSYSQPEDYHFSHDSVFLARFIFELYAHQDIHHFEVLDLCAGSGIIGLDLLFHFRKEKLQSPSRTDFLEVQDVYLPHFQKNSLSFSNTHFLCMNYDQLNSQSPKYDLIVSNPPYFLPHQGKLSPSPFKNRCRFFLDSSFSKLIYAIQVSLKPHGAAYLLYRPTPQNDAFLEDINLEITKVHDIRGTDVLKITKK